MELFKTCYENGIPMLGVCRGAQFLNVMPGGKLYQDVDNHVGDHPIYDPQNKRVIPNVSSIHHQMCIETRKGGMEILAASSAASKRRTEGPRAGTECGRTCTSSGTQYN